MTSWHRKQALSVAALAAAALVAVGSSGAATGEYVPFRTDFPEVVHAESYVPFETDFAITRNSGETSFVLPAKRQQQAAATSGLDLNDSAVAIGLGLALAALAAISALALGRRGRLPGRWQAVRS
jgi:hypothetical protein